jgi:hypothetical protein
MPTFTVLAPPLRIMESTPTPERFKFVYDGFYFWAFALAPLWLLSNRLWLAFFGYMVLSGGLNAGLYLIGVPTGVKFVANFLILLLIGFEAATLLRWTLVRRRWKTLGFVVAEDAEMAERRFYAEWANRADGQIAQEKNKDLKKHPIQEPKSAAPGLRGAPSSSDVIGLFPEPGQP